VSRHVAFLRGINLGKRQIKMAELKACLEAMGLDKVKTLLASGNVIFETDNSKDLKARLDKAISAAFDFDVKVVLRSDDEIAAMIASDPFKTLAADADVKLYVVLLDEAPGKPLHIVGVEGDWSVMRIDPRDIYVVAHKLPNGRYGEGLDKLAKQMDKGVLMTMRNWNTILKARK